MRIGKWAPILSKLTKYLLDLGSHSQPLPLKCWGVISNERLHFSQAIALVKSQSFPSKPAVFSGHRDLGFYVQRCHWEMVGTESRGLDRICTPPPSRRAASHPGILSGPWFPIMPSSQFPNLGLCQPWQCCLSATQRMRLNSHGAQVYASLCMSGLW